MNKKSKLYELKYDLLLVGLILANAIAVGKYYSYSNEKQIISEYSKDYEVDENGSIYKIFQPGEHNIKISRNDAYYHKYEEIEGYKIVSVNASAWRDNTQVIYENVEEVIAYGKLNSKNEVEFDKFGKLVNAKVKTK